MAGSGPRELHSGTVIFLDHAAGEPVRPQLAARYAEYAARYCHNPHGLTCYSERSRRALLDARERLLEAAQIPSGEAEVVWCASGTEAVNLALRGYCWKDPRGAIAADAAAHPALRNTAADLGGHPVEFFLPSRNAQMPRAELAAISLVNNETGAIWMGGWRHPGTRLFLDAAQAFGKIPIPWQRGQVDMLAISGRKIGALPSSAALIVRRATIGALRPVLTGGGQQHGWRSGTVDVPSAVLFADAAQLAAAECEAAGRRTAALNRRLRDGINELGQGQWPIFSPPDASPYILAFAIPGFEGALITRILAQDCGIVVGAGSACSAESHETSPALRASGVADALARGMIRVSFGAENTPEDVEALLQALPQVLKNY